MKKKGYFFILDALIGILIMSIVFVTFLSDPVDVPQKPRLDMVASDVQLLFSSIKFRDLDLSNSPTITEFPVINDLIDSGVISNIDNTLSQQIGEFYYKLHTIPDASYRGNAGDVLGEILEVLPGQYNFEVRLVGDFDDGGGGTIEISEMLYDRTNIAKEDSDVVIVRTSFVFGVDPVPNELWGPYVFEVKMWE
tara:strand:+ start:206 stop:787 length:582 start_codon:yes stop_codon:yes gene_type:complete